MPFFTFGAFFIGMAFLPHNEVSATKQQTEEDIIFQIGPTVEESEVDDEQEED